MLEALLDTRDLGAGLIEGGLMGFQLTGQLVVLIALLFQLALALTLTENLALDAGFQLRDA